LKIWLKMLIGIIIGVLLGLILPKDIVFINDLVKFLSDFALNILLYTTVLYVLTKTFLGYLNIKKNKLNNFKIYGIFFLSLCGSLLFSIIISVGFMNLGIFQPDNNFKILQNATEPLKTYSFLDIILKIINQNMFSSLEGPAQFLLPVVFIAIVFAISAVQAGKKAIYFVESVESLDAILEKISYVMIEIFPFGSIFIVINVFQRNIFTPDKLLLLVKPALCILLLSAILIVFYSIFLYLMIKNKTAKFFVGIIGAALTGFISGNTAASIITLNEHLKRNIGIKSEISDSLTPLGMILNKSGTIVISAVTIMTVILGYSPNILDFKLQILLFLLLFVFSFALDGVNEAGFLAIVSMIMHVPSLHLEQDSYLLFLVFVPILSRIGIFIDVLTTGIFVTVSANFTDGIDKKEYIDFI
jgi:Na+/H+-dicarboxylate symporter